MNRVISIFFVLLSVVSGCGPKTLNSSTMPNSGDGAATSESTITFDSTITSENSAFSSSGNITVASWNVENLFDTEDDPDNEGDDAYTPTGWKRWTEARYQLKLEHLSDVIAHMQPDILGLMEVENKRVLEDLVSVLESRHNLKLPYIFHQDCDDMRGIDVGIIAGYPAVSVTWLQAIPGQRDIVVAEFVINGRQLFVIINHWKSMLGDKAESDAVRRSEAILVRKVIDRKLQQNPTAAIVVAGDFNDMPESPILTQDAGFVLYEAAVRSDPAGRLFFNLNGTLPLKERGTFYYAPQKQWNTLDAIHISHGMLPGVIPAAPWQIVSNSYKIVKTPAQLRKDGTPRPFRRERNKTTGDVYHTGYSDHFPVRVILQPGSQGSAPAPPER